MGCYDERTTNVADSKPPKPALSQRLKDLSVEYGSLAFWVYFAIFAVVLLGFVMAMQLGFHSTTATGKMGVWGAAYVATKLTQPFRIVATLALTPLVMKFVRQWKRPTESS